MDSSPQAVPPRGATPVSNPSLALSGPAGAPASTLLEFNSQSLAGEEKSLMLATLDRPRRDRCEQIAKDQLALFSKGDTVAMITYGNRAQSELAQTSSALLGAIKTRDSGAASDILIDLDNTISSVEKEKGLLSIEKVRRIPIIGEWVTGIQMFLEKAEKAGSKLTRIRGGLDSLRIQQLQTVSGLDELYKQTLTRINQLEEWIGAGELLLAELGRQYRTARTEAADSGDIRRHQDAQDLYSRCVALDQRVYSIKTARAKAITDMPMIRIAQDASIQYATMLQDSIILVIPELERMIVLAKANYDMRKAGQAIAAVKAKVNQLARSNAADLVQNIAAVKELQRTGIYEVDTIVDIVNRLREGSDLARQKDAENARYWREAETKIEDQLNLLKKSQLAASLPSGA